MIATPLKKSRRRLLFYGLIAAFFIVAPVIIFYSFGYTVDVGSRSFLTTGGIFVKTNQTGIKIMLDGKEIQQTSFFNSGALIPNLRAGSHMVRIEKQNYRPWQKTITVQSGVVSEHRNIFLVPSVVPALEEDIAAVNKNQKIFLSPDGIYLVRVLTKDKLMQLEKADTASILLSQPLPPQSSTNSDVFWLTPRVFQLQSSPAAEQAIIFEIVSDARIQQFSITIHKGRLAEKIRQVLINPDDSAHALVLTQSHNVYIYSLVNGIAAPDPILSQIEYIGLANNLLYMINQKGFFVTSDITGRNIHIVERPGFFINGTFRSAVSARGDIAIIDGLGGIFLYKADTQKMIPLSGSARTAIFDEAGAKLLLQGEKALTVVFITPETEFPFRSALTKEVLVDGFSNPINSAVWYNLYYVLFSTDVGSYGIELGSTGDYALQNLGIETGTIFLLNNKVFLLNEKGKFVYALE